MSNNFGPSDAGLITLDTISTLVDQGLSLRRLIYYPSSAGDAAELAAYDSKATPKATMVDKTVTVTLGTTITSVGNFEASEVAVGDVIVITESETGNNLGAFVVKTRSSDDEIIVGEKFTGFKTATSAPLTNEASKVYSWKIITPYTFLPLLSQDTNKAMLVIDFGEDGQWMPNLLLPTLSSGSKIYLFT